MNSLDNRLSIKGLFLISIAVCILHSCNKSASNLVDSSSGIVQVTLSAASFEAEVSLRRAATPYLLDEPEKELTQRNTIELDNGLLLVAELSPNFEVEDVPGAIRSLKDNSRADIIVTNVAPNIRYRLLVFHTSSGAYVTERDYIRGQEATVQPLELDGGVTYTFIAYSVNSAAANLPPVTPAPVANRTLANTQVSVLGTLDFMYFSQTLTVTGNSTNNLNIILKHQFSQITTTINATQTQYNITAVTSNFQPHNTNALVNLSNGAFVRNGVLGTSAVTFPTLGTQTVTSTPTTINTNTSVGGRYTLQNITIGPLQQTNLIPFNNLQIIPGIRYNLSLNIVPNDEYVTIQGIPAARINGIIWQLHNVGVAITENPEQNPITAALHGNYYQFGRNTIAAGPQNTNRGANWSDATNIPRNSWNSGTELVPVKTVSDPCVAGFRLPTGTEFQNLVSATSTVGTNRGNFTSGQANFNSAKVLTSVRRADVRLIIPSQGLFNVRGGTTQADPIENRGSTGNYWTSSAVAGTNNFWRYLHMQNAYNVSLVQSDQFFVAQARTIRCVAQ